VKKLRDFHFFRLSGVSDGGSEDLIAGDLQIRMNAARLNDCWLNDCWFKRLMVYLTNDRRIYVCVLLKSACPNRLVKEGSFMRRVSRIGVLTFRF
jgi:hypothetical protein